MVVSAAEAGAKTILVEKGSALQKVAGWPSLTAVYTKKMGIEIDRMKLLQRHAGCGHQLPLKSVG